ncbi:hypothetical protein ACVWZZ_005455 [Bradyrhizobium sp. LM6.10]
MPRLDRGIQYAAAYRLDHTRLGVLDRPVKPGVDQLRKMTNYSAACCCTVGSVPATVARRMSRGWDWS